MRISALLFCLVLLAGCQSLPLTSRGHRDGATAERAQSKSATRDILKSTSRNAVDTMGQPGSYDIPLPQKIESLRPTLTKIGFGPQLDKMKTRMNQAASEAAAAANPAFREAITHMTLPDAIGLLTGGQTSVTDYFRRSTHDKLAAKMTPIVEDKLEATGFHDLYKRFLGAYKALPITNKPSLDIKSYVVDRVLDGLYGQMAKKEVAIRENPARAGSTLIQRFLSGPNQ